MIESTVMRFGHRPHGIGITLTKKALESSDKVNVDQCISIDKDQVKSFYERLPNGFYESLSKNVVTMAAGKNSVKVGDVDVLDTTLIYSCVMALQMTNMIIEVKVLFSYELTPLHSNIHVQ